MTEEQQQTNLSKEGLTIVLMRNAFYRDYYRRSLFVLLLMVLVNAVLAVGIIHRYLNPPKPQYFATNSQYQLIKWHPLSDPVVSNNYVKQWVSSAIQQAFSLDFMHWRQQLQAASDNFTPTGWHWFLNAFKQSGNLDSLVKLHMVANVEITGSPVIQNQAVLDGRYVWKIEMPLMISYTNIEKTIRQSMKVTIIVQRVSVQDNRNRIAISQFLPEVQSQ